MNTTFPTVHNMVPLPSIAARITPPPEELNIIIPKSETCPVIPVSPGCITQTHSESTTSPSTRRRSRRRSSSSRARPPHVDVRPVPYANSHLIFSPRPYESLYVERAYLTSALQQHSSCAANLMRQYSIVESQLQGLPGDKGRRKLRKQLGLLKSRINEAFEQERVIFSRLTELYIEIQSRESWMQIGYQQQQAWPMDSPSVGTPSVYSPMSYSLPTPTTPLNGACAEFVPMGYFGEVHHLSESSLGQEKTEASLGLETVDEAGEDLLCRPDLPCESVESDTTPATPVAADAPIVEATGLEEASGDVRIMAVRKRRFSLPCLQNAWPET
ncbi:hypothetical protein B0J15DRAFT_298330 [Fusarium solani]|uniref:Uncharacterized protein n=1 Tax=Fusarium solani TaxID=169388 RepID=A0A9P9HKL5_FUSSL|nr:uncharacterized protein B0J15DRAFT_298330 [Fusarium solani]KAH7258382.1 hypothetical protein B0J15DRAFT_298330 [Fusarium solani]